jgi:hypothetical protein
MRKLILLALVVAAALVAIGSSAVLAGPAQDEVERLVVFENFERST